MNAAPPPAPTATACPLDAWLAQNCGAASLEDLPRALHAAQEAALRRQLVQARRAVFYGPRLTGLDLERLTLEDLPRLPFTTPADLRQWQDLLCVSLGAVQRMVTRYSGPPNILLKATWPAPANFLPWACASWSAPETAWPCSCPARTAPTAWPTSCVRP